MAEAAGTQTGVASPPPPAAAAPAAATHVAPSVVAATRKNVRAENLEARPKNTARAYGDVVKLTSGPALEWATWCAAGADVMVFGHKTLLNKVPYTTVVTPDKALVYLKDHVTVRPELTSAQKPKEGTRAGPSVLKKHKKMLAHVYMQQRADNPEDMKDIPHPKTADTASIVACKFPDFD